MTKSCNFNLQMVTNKLKRSAGKTGVFHVPHAYDTNGLG